MALTFWYKITNEYPRCHYYGKAKMITIGTLGFIMYCFHLLLPIIGLLGLILVLKGYLSKSDWFAAFFAVAAFSLLLSFARVWAAVCPQCGLKWQPFPFGRRRILS
ncbi:MAG: hypothetical protein A2V67_10575 [Deltaproteobacteria bacterium RBG_13_61_14]|nr:MAG: hypothetical protein A2V67_10575 [Deltaproteobacteria bacterium RBG_13_61_14]